MADGRCRLLKVTGKWLIGQRKSPLHALPLAVATALLGLALEYMALADGLSRPILEKEQQLQEMQQDPAGYGD